METYSHMMPGVGDVAATTLEEPLADLLLPSPRLSYRGLSFLQDLQVKKRADERTRTAYPCSLRVRNRALQGIAAACYRLQNPLT